MANQIKIFSGAKEDMKLLKGSNIQALLTQKVAIQAKSVREAKK